jgi:hypothetical protein
MTCCAVSQAPDLSPIEEFLASNQQLILNYFQARTPRTALVSQSKTTNQMACTHHSCQHSIIARMEASRTELKPLLSGLPSPSSTVALVNWREETEHPHSSGQCSLGKQRNNAANSTIGVHDCPHTYQKLETDSPQTGKYPCYPEWPSNRDRENLPARLVFDSSKTTKLGDVMHGGGALSHLCVPNLPAVFHSIPKPSQALRLASKACMRSTRPLLSTQLARLVGV